MRTRFKNYVLLSLLITAVSSSYSYAIALPTESADDAFLVKIADIPTIFRFGSGIACTIGSAAAFAASAYILAKSYKAYTSEQETLKKKRYLPPREFFWSMATGTAFIAALFALTETTWSKQA